MVHFLEWIFYSVFHALPPHILGTAECVGHDNHRVLCAARCPDFVWGIPYKVSLVSRVRTV